VATLRAQFWLQLYGFSMSVTQAKVSPTEAELQRLDISLVQGVAWTGAAKWASQVLAWASTLVVARILTPDDYGLVSMATVYLGVLTLVSEFGLGSAVVTLRDLTEEQIAQLNGLSVCLGMVGFAISCAVAVPLGRFFGSPGLPRVIVVMSIGFIATSFQSIPSSLLQKELRFRLLSVIEAIRCVALSGAMVLFALLGLRYWTLVFGALLSSIMGTLLTLAKRRHRLAWPCPSSLKHAIRFSRQVLVGRLAWYGYSNADFVVAGRMLGQAALGTYTVAWNLANAPLEKITSLVGSVTPAYYSAVQEDRGALRRYLLKPTEAISLIMFPVMVGMAFVSRDAVLSVLGQKWQGAIAPLQLLALYACVRSIMPLIAQVLMVTGDSGFVMWNGIISAVALPIAFLIGSHWGPQGIAAAWVVAYPINAVPLYLQASRRISLSKAEFWRALSPATHGTLLMALVLSVVRLLLSGHFAMVTRLVIQVLSGAIAYVAVVLLFHRDRLAVFRRGFGLLAGRADLGTS
jgi:O-antigen/teichoic acid export membrane protein